METERKVKNYDWNWRLRVRINKVLTQIEFGSPNSLSKTKKPNPNIKGPYTHNS